MIKTVTLAEQITEVEREIAVRRKVFPDWIARGMLKETMADHRLSAMVGVLETLRLMHSIAVWCAENQAVSRREQRDLFDT